MKKLFSKMEETMRGFGCRSLISWRPNWIFEGKKEWTDAKSFTFIDERGFFMENSSIMDWFYHADSPEISWHAKCWTSEGNFASILFYKKERYGSKITGAIVLKVAKNHIQSLKNYLYDKRYKIITYKVKV